MYWAFLSPLLASQKIRGAISLSHADDLALCHLRCRGRRHFRDIAGRWRIGIHVNQVLQTALGVEPSLPFLSDPWWARDIGSGGRCLE